MDDITQLTNELEKYKMENQQYREQLTRNYFRLLIFQSLFSDIPPDEDCKIVSRPEAQGLCYCLNDAMNDCKT